MVKTKVKTNVAETAKINARKILFRTCCDNWLNWKKNTIKESSYLNYKFKVNKHIKPALGRKTLEEIERYDMTNFIMRKKMKEKYNQVDDLIIILRSILKYAKRRYKIDFDFDFSSKFKSSINDIDVFNENEKQRLYRYLTKTTDVKDMGVLISLYSGLRIGEVCGLKWEDVDLNNKVIHVKRTVQRIYIGKNRESKVIITPPKTRKSIRKIPISKVLLGKLKQFAPQYSTDSYIITGTPEKCSEPLNYRYTYRKVLKSCALAYKKYHVLRHTFATRCIRVGMDIKSLSEVLGHSNIGITMNIYVHSSYEVKKKYIDKL